MPNFNLPNMTDADLDSDKSKKQIKNYLYQLTEQLRYVLNNLDSDNLSEGLSEQISGIAALQLEADKSKSELATAITNATELLTAALNGYVIKRNGEILIMDTEYPETATKVWRWNLNGLGYSSSGIDGPYGTAITMDGNIVANYITTGVLTSILIQSDNYTQDGSGNPLTGMKINLNDGTISGSKFKVKADGSVEISSTVQSTTFKIRDPAADKELRMYDTGITGYNGTTMCGSIGFSKTHYATGKTAIDINTGTFEIQAEMRVGPKADFLDDLNMVTGNINFSQNKGLVWATASNDYARIIAGSYGTNLGYLEIATADDGTEPIHVAQYTGVFASEVRKAVLLDANGDTNFPGAVTWGPAYNISNGLIQTNHKSGFYRGSNVNGAPDSGWWYFIFIRHDDLWNVVQAFPLDHAGYVWWKVQRNGTWTDWMRINA